MLNDLINYLLENELPVCISPSVPNEIYLILLKSEEKVKIDKDFTVSFSEYMHGLQTGSRIIHTTKENINQDVFKELLNYL